MKKLICKLIGHDWTYLEKTYEGEINGKLCMRCMYCEEFVSNE